MIPQRQLFNNRSDIVILVNKCIHSDTNSTFLGSIQPRYIVLSAQKPDISHPRHVDYHGRMYLRRYVHDGDTARRRPRLL